MTGGKVLVLGDDTRSFLAIVRSLGRRGITVHVAPSNFRSPALRSRYVTAIHDLPPWMEDGAEWLVAIETLLRSARFDLVIPCTEVTLLPLQRHRERLSALTGLAIPDDQAIAVLFDKYETRNLAGRVGVPVAIGRLLRAEDTAEKILTEFSLPVVVKPRHSYSLHTLASRGKAQVVADPLRLARILTQWEPQAALLEGFFPGQGVGISLLANRGRVLQAFQHHRVHELDGASFYRVSAPLTPDLAQACEGIVAAIAYTGLAMFEFRRNNAGEWILLEINARPWGSMPLPLALGVDFPYRWYRLLTKGEETQPVAYRSGVYGRNLLPDLRASIAEAQARLSKFAKASFVIQRLAELFRPFSGKEVHDLLVRDDPWPGLVELGEIFLAAGQRLGRRLPGEIAWQRRRARARVRAAKNGTDRMVVLFVCQGNICRSPFAAALLRARMGNSPIVIQSAGVMPQQGRQTPDLGQEAAITHGVDLSAHRSTWLTRQTAETASLLVLFDETNRAALFDRYPDIETAVVHLGQLAALGDITDPIGGRLADFQHVFDQISKGIEELASLLLTSDQKRRLKTR